MRELSKRRLLKLCLLGGISLFALPPSVQAKSTELSYHIVKMDLAAVFKEISLDTSTTIVATPKTRGSASNLSLVGSVDEILTDLARQHGLDWFTYNDVYYVSSRQEATTRVINLGDISPHEAIAALEGAGLWQANRKTATTFEDGVLILTGPPQLLALVEAVVQYVRGTPDAIKAARPTVRIRKGGDLVLAPIDLAGQPTLQTSQ